MGLAEHGGFVGRFGAVAAWLALAAILLSALALGANRPVSWTALSISALTVLGLMIASGARPPRLSERRMAWPAGLWLAVVAWSLIQTVPGAGSLAHPAWSALPDGHAAGLQSISADPAAGATMAARLTAYAALFWIAATAAADARRAGAMLRVIAVCGTALAVYGIAAAALGLNPVLGFDGERRTVVSASFLNRNSYATYAAFGLLANLGAYLMAQTDLDEPERLLRDALEGFLGGGWVYALGAAVCATALVATQSRAGAAAGVIGIAAFALVWRRRASGSAALLGLVGFIGVFVALTTASGLTRRLFSASGEEARFVVFPRVMAGIADRPLLGHGLGAFEDAFRAYVPFEAAVGEWDKAHNSYLENVFELGVPAGIVFYVALALIVVRLAKGARERRQNRVFACVALGATATAAFHTLFDFSLQMPATAALFAFICGIGWAQSFTRKALTAAHVDRKRTSSSRHTAVKRPE